MLGLCHDAVIPLVYIAMAQVVEDCEVTDMLTLSVFGFTNRVGSILGLQFSTTWKSLAH
jgi:hypothetical protein